MATPETFRVLIASTERLLTEQFKVYLREKGFEVEHAQTADELRTIAQSSKPHFLVADLMFPDLNGFEIVNWIKVHPFLKNQTRVIIAGAHNNISNVKNAIRMGAMDYWVKPVDPEKATSRLVFHISRRRTTEVDSLASLPMLDPSTAQLHLLDLMMRETMRVKLAEDSLFNVTRMLAMNLKCVRVSVVACSDDLEAGWVVASSDERSVAGLKLNLDRYPEINHVLLSEQMVVIENMENDSRLAEIKKQVKSIMFNSIFVCPIYRKGKIFGVLSCRMGIDYKSFQANHIRFVRLAAIAAGFVLERDDRTAEQFAKIPVTQKITA